MARPMTPSATALWSVGIAGCVLGVIMISGALRPVELLHGARAGQGSEVIVRDFGPEHLRPDTPFDGQYIYVAARLLPDLDAIADSLHEADYRLVRILHPLLASPAPTGTPTILALQLWNLVGVGLFAVATADMLRRHNQNPSWAVAGTLAAFALSLLLTTSEPLAFGLGMAGLCLVDRRQLTWAIPLLALAGLTRESALTFAAAAAALVWARRSHALAIWVLVAAALPTAAWWMYVQSITERSRTPLGPLGILQMGSQPWDDTLVSAFMLCAIALSVVAWRDVPPLFWLAVSFAAWIPLYEGFAFKMVNLPRLSSPSLALAVIGVMRWHAGDRTGTRLGRGDTREPAPREPSALEHG